MCAYWYGKGMTGNIPDVNGLFPGGTLNASAQGTSTVPPKPGEPPCPGGMLNPGGGECPYLSTKMTDRLGSEWCCPSTQEVCTPPCGAGFHCENKRCVPDAPKKTILACVDGTCRQVVTATPENQQACVGKMEGDACAGGPEDRVLACRNGSCANVPRKYATADEIAACADKKLADRCVPIKELKLACRDGSCKKVLDATTVEIAACAGKVEGTTCVAKGCTLDTECQPGEKCVNGVCTKGGTCPEGVGPAYAGCACGKEYATTTGTCPEGYVFVSRPKGGGWEMWKEGAVGRCECSKWCEATGYGTDCKGGGQAGGAFQFPPGMQELMDLLLGRSKDLLGKEGGYSQEAMDYMYGRNFEKIRGQEEGAREAARRNLQSAGMLGGGEATKALGDISWNTEQGVSDIMRQLFVGNEEKKKQDLIDYTTLANSLFGTGMNYEQLLEAINAARRGEGNQSMMLLLQLLSLLKNQ